MRWDERLIARATALGDRAVRRRIDRLAARLEEAAPWLRIERGEGEVRIRATALLRRLVESTPLRAILRGWS